jgi:hypothetical protein
LPGLRVRDYNKSQEAEAYGVGAAVLLPWGQFFHSLNAGDSVCTLAEDFDVTEALIEYRIKVTGATNLYRNRVGRRNAVSVSQQAEAATSAEAPSRKESKH